MPRSNTMSALLLELHPALARAYGRKPQPGRDAALALLVGALAPWLLLVGLQGDLLRAATSCLAGPLPA